MDMQNQTEMAQKAVQEDRGPREDVTEEQFLKDLYLFMKKRNTPIERIPHLGFRQIDLYLMFKTVKELGGYHQVTAQQLWKQVYNTLGGNPRSTSAATCTRRHYEKLMLPYECHIKGLHLNVVQPRSYHYMGHKKPEEDGPQPIKRRPEPFPLQNAPGAMPEHYSGLFPPSPSYHKFYYPLYSHPPHSLMPPPRLPVPPLPPESYVTCTPPLPVPPECPHPLTSSKDCPKDPVECLRYLAKQYESSVGLSGPLDLSDKSSRSDITANPVSSFAPPSLNKNPKFLNKPSPLYASQNAKVKSDTEGDVAAPSLLSNLKECSKSISQAVSTDADLHNRETTETQQNPGVKRINESASSVGENGGRMEIEVPLSVFNNWLQMCGPQTTLHGPRQLLLQEVNRTKSSVAKTEGSNFTLEIKQSQLEDGNLWHVPSQICTSEHDSPGQYHHNNHSPTYSVLKNAASTDSYLLNDAKKPCSLKRVPTVCWDLTDSSAPTPPKQVSVTTNRPTVPQDFRPSKPYIGQHHVQRQPESEVLQLNPLSMLQLTPEEVLKLKKIISNSA